MADFIQNINDDELNDLSEAANILDIKSLLDLSCAQLATIFRRLSVPELRERFKLINDFTPEEEAKPWDEAKIEQLVNEYEREEKAKKEAEKAN